MDFTQKQVLITGGSSGIGLALAKALASLGANICLLARDEKKLASALNDVKKMAANPNQKMDVLSCDIRDYEKSNRILQAWCDREGVPDMLINSAGVTYPGYFEDIEIDRFKWLMDINYFGTLHTIKILAPKMMGRGSGAIINISSQAGFIGVFGYSGYSASKYAVRGLSDVLRAELKTQGIQVAIVFPPDTQTPQLAFETPLKPFETKEITESAGVMTANQVAQAILKGIKKGRYVIIPGLEGKLFYRLVNLLGNLTYPIMDLMVRQAQKKKRKKLQC